MVDEAESSAGITDSGVAFTFDNLISDNSTHGIDFPESTVVNDGEIEWFCGSNLFVIDMAY